MSSPELSEARYKEKVIRDELRTVAERMNELSEELNELQKFSSVRHKRLRKIQNKIIDFMAEENKLIRKQNRSGTKAATPKANIAKMTTKQKQELIAALKASLL